MRSHAYAQGCLHSEVKKKKSLDIFDVPDPWFFVFLIEIFGFLLLKSESSHKRILGPQKLGAVFLAASLRRLPPCVRSFGPVYNATVRHTELDRIVTLGGK